MPRTTVAEDAEFDARSAIPDIGRVPRRPAVTPSVSPGWIEPAAANRSPQEELPRPGRRSRGHAGSAMLFSAESEALGGWRLRNRASSAPAAHTTDVIKNISVY